MFISALFVSLTLVTSLLVATTAPAQAATSNTLNFQGRLLTATGGLVPDGTYNMEFNLYYVDTAGVSQWTEDRLNTNTQGVTVVNGYYSVYLGQYDSIPALDWSEDLYLGMTIRGTGSCAWGSCTPADSEMTPRFKLTSVPYAFKAANVASSNTNAASTNSDGVSITTGDAIGATSNSGNITLDVGTATGTAGVISIGGANASSILIGNSGMNTTVQGTLQSDELATFNGDLRVSDGSSNYATITVDATAGDYTYMLPTTTANDTFCLETLNNCGSGSTTLQASYNADVDGGDAVVGLTAADGAVIFRDAASTIGTLFVVESNGGTDYLSVSSTAINLGLDTTIASGKLLTVTTLGSADTNTFLCRNTSNQLATCSNAPLISALTDNITDALDLQEGTNNYININTTDASENISFGNVVTNPSYNFLGSGTLTVSGAVDLAGGLIISDPNSPWYVGDTLGSTNISGSVIIGNNTPSDVGSGALSVGVTSEDPTVDPTGDFFGGNFYAQVYGNTNARDYSASSAIAVSAAGSLSAPSTTLLKAVGFSAEAGTIFTSTGSTLTNAIAFEAKSAFNNAGTITNAYGLYVQSQTAATNDYGIYVEGADTYALFVDAGVSRFDGAVQLGNTSTSGQLAIHDGTTDTGSLAVTALSANRTYTFPDATGEVSLLGQSISNAELDNSQLAVNTGSGLASGGSISLGGSRTLTLGDLTADWVQTGGYDIILSSSSSDLRIMEGSGGLYYGEFDVADLTADRLYTFPNATGEVTLLGQSIDNGELANSSVTINGNTGLSGGGLLSLGGTLTLTVDLGNSIDGAEITDGVIEEADLEVTNAGTNAYILSYDSATGGFTWTNPGTLNTGGVDSVNSLTGAIDIVGNTQVGIATAGQNINITINSDSITAAELNAGSVGTSELAATSVSLGSYGSASSVATFTVDADGRLTAAGTTTIAIDASAVTSGTMTIAQGGTGATSFTTNAVLYGNNTSAIQATLAGTSGQVLLANASGVPTFTTFSGDLSVSDTGITTISANAVGSSEVTDASLTYDDLAADSVTASEVATGAVTSDEILDNTIQGVDLEVTAVATDNYVLTFDSASGGFTWIDGGTLGTTLSEAQVEDYIFDGDNGVKSLGSGELALSSLTYTGNLEVAQGGTGITSAGAAGGVFYSDGTDFANTGAGTAGQCVLSNGAGAPSWGNCGGSGAGAVTLQVAYDNGPSITTTDNRSIAYTLADTATDSNLTVNIATSSTGKFAVQYNASDLLRIDSNGIDLVDVDIADFTGATVTFDAGEIDEAEIAQDTLDDSEIANDILTAGSLAADSVSTSELAATAVSLGSYGSASSVATFTVDADGRLTAAASTAIAINASAITAGTLGVDRGGTGAATFTSNGVLYGNATGALQVTAAGTGGQILMANGSGVPTFTSISGDLTVSNTGVTAIQSNAVVLGTDTSGDYVSNITAGTGVAVTGTIGENWTPTVALSYSNTLASNSLSANQTTFADAGVIFEGTNGDAFETLLTVTNPSGNNSIALPDASGTVAISASGNIALSAAGAISFTGTLPVASGGTGAGTFTTGGILLGNGTSAISDSGVLTNGQLLIGDGTGAPTIGTIAQSTGISVTNGAGTISIASTLGTDIVGSEISNGTIEAVDLEVTNAPTNGYILSYDSATGGFTWIDPSGVATNEATVESYIFDADNVGTLSTGTLALNTLSYTGNLTVAQGGTGITAAGAAGGVYYSTGTAFANSGAGTSGNCLLSNGAGAPSWGTCGGGAGTATLQNVYDNGNNITTTNNRNIAFDLADTATDSDFIVNLLGTGNLFDVQDAGVSKLTVESVNGYVGVNDSSPSYQLDVAGDGRFTNNLLVDGNTTLGNASTDTITFTGVANSSLLANNTAGGTVRTTAAGGGTNTTTVTLTVAGYANGDVIYINNAGQDYYTRITSGGGTTSLTVDPAVSWDASCASCVTNYTIQNIGAASTGTTFANSNRFFQGYFLGGVVTGAGSTTLSDGNLNSTGNLILQRGGGKVGIGSLSSLSGNKLSVVTDYLADDTLPALGANGGKLGLFNSSSATGNNYGLIAGVLSTGNVYLQSQRVDGTATAYNILLQPNGGGVHIGGVGTTTARLEVLGSSTNDGISYISTTAGNTHIGFQNRDTYMSFATTGAFYVRTYDGAAYSTKLTITGAGAATFSSSLDVGTTLTINGATTAVGQISARTGLNPYWAGADSGLTGARHYQYGYQSPGAWSSPYPNLVLGYHTGVDLGANTSYGGVQFWDDHPSVASTLLMSVGNGNSNVAVTNTLTVGGTYAFAANTTGDKINLYSNTYGIGIESGNLTSWSNSSFRWRIGGTSVSSGTQYAAMTASAFTFFGGDIYSQNGASYSRVHHNGANGYYDSQGGDLILRATDGSPFSNIAIDGVAVADTANHICLNSTNELAGCTSSVVHKHNIQNISYDLNTLRQLRPVTFNWNDGNKADVGFIAEEVAQILPEAVEWYGPGEYFAGQVKNFDNSPIVSLLTKSLQQLDVQVQGIDTRLAVLESGQLNGNLNVANDAEITGNLTVIGVTELATLKVTGLTEVADLKVNGKIITAGITPTAVLGATTTGQGSTYTIEGNDTAGSITLTAGTGTVLNPLAAGEQATITFNVPFSTEPRVTLTPTSEDAANIRFYVLQTGTEFRIVFTDVPVAGDTYSFNYQVIQ